jgi:hypothetical protein
LFEPIRKYRELHGFPDKLHNVIRLFFEKITHLPVISFKGRTF